jgi:hypothetical protein
MPPAAASEAPIPKLGLAAAGAHGRGAQAGGKSRIGAGRFRASAGKKGDKPSTIAGGRAYNPERTRPGLSSRMNCMAAARIRTKQE